MSENLRCEEPQWLTQVAPSCIGTYGKLWEAVVWLDREAPFLSVVEEPGYQAIGYTERHESHGVTLDELYVRHGIARSAAVLGELDSSPRDSDTHGTPGNIRISNGTQQGE